MPPPVEGPASHYLTPAAIETVAREIAEAGGIEVFFIGRLGREQLVEEVEAHAFGSREAVPVLMNLVRSGEVILHNHPSGQLEPSDADLRVSSTLGNLGVGSFIVDNACTRLRVVVRPQVPREKARVAPQEVERLLGPKSALASALGEYENRPEQQRMSLAVARALNEDGIAVIEAGTGTGKSIAYLVPSLLYALDNRERVVVSTHTINLQEQILHKDLPVVRRALDREFEAVIVKGRSNYVCKRKAQMAREELAGGQQSLIDDEHAVELREVLAWAAASPTGDRTELTVPPRDEVWERVGSESDNCLRLRCPFYEECFFYNSRRHAARADLLVVNHSLLLSDLAVRRESGNWTTAAVLPPYRHVVLDEAHHLEEVATRHLGTMLGRPGLRRLFGRLARTDARVARRRGLYATLEEKLEELRKAALITPDHPLCRILMFDLMPGIESVRDQCETLIDDFGHAFMDLVGIERVTSGHEHRIRLLPGHTAAEAWEGECLPPLQAFAREIGLFLDRNRQALEALGTLADAALERLRDVALEWRALVERLDVYRRLAVEFGQDREDVCRWVEIGRDRRERLSIQLCSAPISVANLLRESLHDRMRSEVLTSATLAVDEDFSFLFERIGLVAPPAPAPAAAPESESDAEDQADRTPAARAIESLILGSSYDYTRQVLLGVPSDLGDPRSAGFDDRLARFIVGAVAASDGRAFVLFTSWNQMRAQHQRCAEAIRALGIECLVQGEESRDHLLRRFRRDETSVLFATSSFWEGVDVRGRALELLIIARLPFAVPNEPIQEAQHERLQQQGRDPFHALAVPRAVIRLKQGFGRLIRSRTDRGAVLVADERLVRAGYGRRFVRSLPPVEVAHETTDRLLERTRAFLAGERLPQPRSSRSASSRASR
jgi:ATP-dependent DNA helicase DinG